MPTYAGIPRIDRRTQLAWVAGTVATPIAKTAFPVFDVDRQQEKFDVVDGATDIGRYQPHYSAVAGRQFDFGFGTYIAAILTADGAPHISSLLRACAMAEATTGTTPNIAPWYQWGNTHFLTGTPSPTVPGNTDPVDITINQDGLARTAADCVGNAVLRWEARKRPTVRFTIRGTEHSSITRYIASSAEAALTAMTLGPTPKGVGAAAQSIQFVAETAITTCIIPFIEVDLRNNIDVRDDVGGVHGYSTPSIAGGFPTLKMRVETQDLSIADWETRRRAADYITVKWSHDAPASNYTVGVTNKHGFRGYITDLQMIEYNGKLCYDVTLEQMQETTINNGFWIAWCSTAEATYPF